ncbi:MAG: hypothetical protein Fur0018_25490 [Anaerolineales bacterium]
METPDLDSLTGAYTRAILQQRMDEELNRAQRTGDHVTLLMLDVDYFKSINDAFGHAVGDQALKALAQRIKKMVRKNDLIFRYGGDEFVLLLTSTSHLQVTFLCQRLLYALKKQPFDEISPPLYLSISGGTATYPRDGQTIEALFSVADQRHYTAKRQGRGRIITEDVPLFTSQIREIRPPERIIGGDTALTEVQTFIKTLSQTRRATLNVLAEEGMGEEILLQHLRRLARLQGYLIMHVHPSPGLQKRAHGALREAEIIGIPTPPMEWDLLSLPETWLKFSTEKHATGWLVIVDDWERLDEESRTLLSNLYQGDFSTPFGLVYVTKHHPIWKTTFPWNAAARQEVEIEPLSMPQTQAWLRQAMSWEPPANLVAYLQQVTGGKPGMFIPLIHALQENHILRNTETGEWLLLDDEIILPEEALHPTAPPVTPLNIEDTFIGHHQLIAELKERVHHQRLISIIAPGGVGKTRLAQQVLLETGTTFTDGACFVALEGTSDAAHIPETIAHALPFPLDSSAFLEDAVCQALENRHCLLILDNFEHLRGGEAYIRRLLQATSDAHILVTSRTPLNLPEEQRVFLHGLPTPPPDYTLETLASVPAVQFMVKILRRQILDFTLSEQNHHLVAGICRITAGMPLALQMVTSWVALIPLEDLLQRLEHGTGLLTEQYDTIRPTQQSSIRAAFSTIWDILSAYERQALTHVTIFPSTFSFDAIHHIASISLFFLDGLVQHALLWKLPEQRYQVHPLLRQILEEHISPEDVADLRQKFIAYYTAFAVQAAGQWQHIPATEWLANIRLELDNLRQTWDWALEAEDFTSIDGMLPMLHNYYEHNGWFQDAYTTFGHLSAIVERHLQAHKTHIGRALYRHTLLLMGKYAYHLGLYDEALKYLETSRAYLNFRTHRKDAYTLTATLATVYRARGEHKRAFRYRLTSHKIALRLGDTSALAEEVSNLAILYYDQGRLEEAERFLNRALTYYRQDNNEARIAAILNNLGNVAYEREDYEQAQHYLSDSLHIAERIAGQTLLAAVLDSLAKVYTALGQYRHAWDCLQRGIHICQKVAALPLAMELVNNLGSLLATLGDIETAGYLWRVTASHPQTLESVHNQGLQALQRYHLAATSLPAGDLPSLNELLKTSQQSFFKALQQSPSQARASLAGDTDVPTGEAQEIPE